MDNNLIMNKKNNFEKFKSFAIAKKEILRVVMAVLMLVEVSFALIDLVSDVSTNLGNGFSLGMVLLFIPLYFTEILADIGYGITGIVVLTKKGEKMLFITPFLIGVGFILYGITYFGYSAYIFGIISVVWAILWVWMGIMLKSNKYYFEKEKSYKIMIIVAIVLSVVEVITTGLDMISSLYDIVIKVVIFVLFVMTQLSVDEKIPDSEKEMIVKKNKENIATYDKVNNRYPENYTEVWKIIVFSILTLGIYFFIWIYRTVGLLNIKNSENQSQGLQVVLCLFVPFYIIYWMYKESKRIEIYAERVGNTNDSVAVLSLILTIFGLGIVAAALMQDQINKNLLVEENATKNNNLYKVPVVNSKVETSTAVAKEESTHTEETKTEENKNEDKTARISNNDIETLIKLKSLLEDGILTEEEFQIEKKKFLNK